VSRVNIGAMYRLRGDGWGRLIRVLAPLGALLVEGWPAFVATLIIQEGGLWLARRFAETCQATFVSRLFLAAYGLRMAITLPTHYIAKLGDGNGALFQDDYTNDLVGEWLLRIARGDGISIFAGHQHLLESVYPYLLMGTNSIFGYAPLIPRLFNLALGALSAVLIFEMTRRTFGKPAAIIAAIGAAVLPTMVIWSVVSLKESLVLFAAVVGLWLVQFLLSVPAGSGRIGDAVVWLAAIVALLLDLRSTLALMLLGLVLVAWMARSRVRTHSWQIGFAALAVVIVAGGGLWFARARTTNRPLTSVVEDVALQIRHRRAQEAASARSQLRPEADVLSATGSSLPAAEAASDAAPFTVMDDVLDPLGYALLAPAPWQARSLADLGASAEMPVWYVLLGASLLAWRAKPHQRVFVVCLVVYGIGNWLVLAGSEGNLGNLLRHRLTLDPVLLMLGAAGLEWLWARAGRPFSSWMPAALVTARGDAS
jgi:4-amino-4-deoxy-L-arabinose transferase-like glycosyltransferase